MIAAALFTLVQATAPDCTVDPGYPEHLIELAGARIVSRAPEAARYSIELATGEMITFSAGGCHHVAWEAEGVAPDPSGVAELGIRMSRLTGCPIADETPLRRYVRDDIQQLGYVIHDARNPLISERSLTVAISDGLTPVHYRCVITP